MMIIRRKIREIILIAVVVIIGFVITLFSDTFFTLNNISNLLNNNAVLGIMSVGMMVIITTGNIDLSVGPQFAVVGMVTAAYISATGGENIILTFIIAMLTGVALGFVNGFFVSKLMIPAIVVTLGTLNVFRGTLYVITNGNMIQNLSGPFTKLSIMKIGPLTIATYIWIFVMVLTYFLLYRTRIGRDVLAVGGNKTAAERLGINPSRIYFFAFGYMGLLAGLASALSVSKIKMAAPTSGAGYEMALIAATVIGGTAFAGGIASILGTYLGIVLLGMIYNGLVLTKVPVYWQDLLTGLIIIIAITSSAFKASGNRKKMKRINAKTGGEEAQDEYDEKAF